MKFIKYDSLNKVTEADLVSGNQIQIRKGEIGNYYWEIYKVTSNGELAFVKGISEDESNRLEQLNQSMIDKLANSYSKADIDANFYDKDESYAITQSTLASITSGYRGTISPTDPAPTLDGVYKPKITQNEAGTPITYTNLGGIQINTAEDGDDYGMSVTVDKKDSVFTKITEPLPDNSAEIKDWTAGTYAKDTVKTVDRVIYRANKSTSQEPGAGADWDAIPDLTGFATKNEGVTFTVEESTNLLDPAKIQLNKFISASGNINTPDVGAGPFNVIMLEWGDNTKVMIGNNGLVRDYFSAAQYDNNGDFIAGTYQGTTVSPPINKHANAKTVGITYRPNLVNQVNWGNDIQPYEPYFLNKTANKDSFGNDVTFKASADDPVFSTFAKSGGSLKTMSDIDAEKIGKSNGVGFITTVIPGSSNRMNPANIVIDKYINSSGGISSGTPSGSYSIYDGSWGDMIEFVTAFNGLPRTIYSAAQYDNAGAYVPGTYIGTTVAGAMTKHENAVSYKFTFRPPSVNINQINSGSEVLPYQGYYPESEKKVGNADAEGTPATFKPDTTDADFLAIIGRSETPESFVTPGRIYCLCNDLEKNTSSGFATMNFSSCLYVDHFLNLTERKKARFRSTQSDKLPLFAPVSLNNATYNGGSSVLTSSIADVIEGDMETIPFSVDRVSVLASSVAEKFPKVLFLGDSVTNGTGALYPLDITFENPSVYWSYIKKLNVLYKEQNGGDGFDFLTIGKQSARSFKYKDTTYKCFAEGRGSWGTGNYLYDEVGPLSRVNYFFDATKVGDVKFSLSKYLSDYKTLADDGITRLQVGTTAGALVTDVNAHDVCTPTHVVIQLGFNDSGLNYQENIPLLIAAIKDEYPGMIIIISVIDAAGTYYPELYPMFNAEGVDLLGDTLHAKNVWAD